MATTDATVGQIGWCHHCMTYQLRADARWAPWYPGGPVQPCCVHCDGEPWGFGVWTMDDGDVEPIPGRPGEYQERRCVATHAMNRDSHYPGDCDCERFPVEVVEVVQTRCVACDYWMRFALIGETPSGGEMWAQREGDDTIGEDLNAGDCVHMQDHHTAASRAIRNQSGRSSSGMVRATLKGVERRSNWTPEGLGA